MQAGRTGRIVLKVFPNLHVPCSPKLVSFPCSLQCLIWVYTVCIGLSVPKFRFFKFVISVSLVCISDEKRLYNLTNISLFFALSCFPSQFHLMLPLRARGFFMGPKGLAYSGCLHLYFCNLNWRCECPRIVCNSTNIYLYPPKCVVRHIVGLLFKGSYLHMP